MKKVYLVLSNGKIFEGESFGYEKEVFGELVFTTSMTGYIETLSDPGFCGQIVVSTFPLIGNYGAMEEDMQSAIPSLKALVVRHMCEQPSNFRATGTLDTFMKKYGIVGISGIDTRELTSIIREHGSQVAFICESVTDQIIELAKNYKIIEACKEVGTTEIKTFSSEGCSKYNVTVIDYGVQKNLIDNLIHLGCNVSLVPRYTTAEDIISTNPDGIILSGGPGNPQNHTESIEIIKALIGKKPILGVCLGHQLLALAMGAQTFKMKCGHRGENQPVIQPGTCRTYITSQNHGYAVDAGSLPPFAKVLYENANDGTCEGIEYPKHCAFSVQFRPQASDASDGSSPVFDHFIKMIGGEI